MSDGAPIWIFGYGSLIFRPAFDALQRRRGRIRGYVRRFWQASTDHRGTPSSPGRVVTLVPREQGCCWGVAYEVAANNAASVLAALDVREKGGYRRLDIDVEISASERVEAITYYADDGNDNYVGETPLEQIAEIARVAVGPSGRNRDYVVQLDDALGEIGATDPHVSELAKLVRSA